MSKLFKTIYGSNILKKSLKLQDTALNSSITVNLEDSCFSIKKTMDIHKLSYIKIQGKVGKYLIGYNEVNEMCNIQNKINKD